MKVNQAKEHYKSGFLKGFRAVRDIEPGCWLLIIEGKEGESWTFETIMGQKSFTSLDPLVTEVESITGHVSNITIGI